MTATREHPQPAQAEAHAWAIRIRLRDGFGWAEPVLATESTVGWYEDRRHSERDFLDVALYATHADAERIASDIRSAAMSAIPVPVQLTIRGLWA
jgi:hypothetical protein